MKLVMAYVFNAPTLWNFDFSMQMYGAILMMSGAYCLSNRSLMLEVMLFTDYLAKEHKLG